MTVGGIMAVDGPVLDDLQSSDHENQGSDLTRLTDLLGVWSGLIPYD